MKNFSEHQRLWFYRLLTLAVTAFLAHLLAVWAAPRLIMQVLMHGPAAQKMNMHNQTELIHYAISHHLIDAPESPA